LVVHIRSVDLPDDGAAAIAGFSSEDGMPLPGPRRSLGVQFWQKGVPTMYAVMIPRSTPAPCSARQVFTTVHDNEETAAIIIHYGEGPDTNTTQVLGQLNLNGIPPAPKDVPRIEVTFTLSAALRLTVRVRDLDTQRQKEWLQRGDVTLIAGGV
jgi:molecular chaperone DnaK (HSP70)